MEDVYCISKLTSGHMARTYRNTLLALLLALKNLENILTEDEQKALADLGQQLKLDPNDWYFIEDDLMGIIEANDALKLLYQQAKAKLDELDDKADGVIPPDLLLANKEAQKAAPQECMANQRLFFDFESKPNNESNEIVSKAIRVLTNPESAETAKKSTFLGKLWKILNQHI